MTVSKLKIVVLVIVALILVVTIAVLLLQPGKSQNPAAPVPAASAPSFIALAALPPATTQSANAADSYIEAFKLFRQLQATPADIALFDQYDESNRFDDRAADFFDRYAMIVSWVRSGAGKSCDWGHASIAERLPVLNQTRAVAIFMVLHARYAAETNDRLAATDDLVATLAFARHVGGRGLLIDKLVEEGIEALAIDPLTAMLPSLSKQRLAYLSKQLDDLPPSTTGKQLMQAEHDTVLQTARDQNQSVQIDAINAMEEFYKAVGEAMDQPPDTFNKVADEQVAKLQEGSVPKALVKVLVPSLKRARISMATAEAKRAKLRSDIDALMR